MAEKKISQLTAKGATVADTDLLVVSESAGGGTYVTKSVTGANVKSLVTDANLTTTDITTNDVSTSKHGFAPKAPNDTTKFLRGDGTWAVPAAGGLTEFTEAETTATPNATVPVNSLTPVTATTNADFAIVPKGNGAILADIPDNTAAGGNKRGTNAIDLQTLRASASNVASGNSSTTIGTYNSATTGNATAIGYNATASGSESLALTSGTASGQYSFAQGSSTTASGSYSVALGINNTASGYASLSLGRYTTADGNYSSSFGNATKTNGIVGRFTRGHFLNDFADNQKSDFFLGIRTTNATPATLTVGGGGASTTNQVILTNQSAYRYKGTIIGKKSGTTDVAAWDVDGLIVRGANAASTTLLIDNVTLVQNTPAWGTPDLTADTTNGGLKIEVTGAASTNIQWTATIETTEVIYA